MEMSQQLLLCLESRVTLFFPTFKLLCFFNNIWLTSNSTFILVSTCLCFMPLFCNREDCFVRVWPCIFTDRSFPGKKLVKVRNSHQRCSVRKGFIINFAKFTGKHLCKSLFFNKVAGCDLYLKCLCLAQCQNVSEYFLNQACRHQELTSARSARLLQDVQTQSSRTIEHKTQIKKAITTYCISVSP